MQVAMSWPHHLSPAQGQMQSNSYYIALQWTSQSHQVTEPNCNWQTTVEASGGSRSKQIPSDTEWNESSGASKMGFTRLSYCRSNSCREMRLAHSTSGLQLSATEHHSTSTSHYGVYAQVYSEHTIYYTHRNTCIAIQNDHSYFEGRYVLNQLRQNATTRSTFCISSLTQSYCLLMRHEDTESPEPTSARTSMGNSPGFWNLHTLKQWSTLPMYELDIYQKSAIWMQFLQ